ncbi:MAG: DNA helicase RecQ [Dehalococcoidia bacterium]|nr:DNA helicase RecQ [Dehalococcoidia bacterium]PKB85411.1 MAG: DNA helicase RecQ [SAR202 cluster bacterium MP-NPac-SRR3961935-G1]
MLEQLKAYFGFDRFLPLQEEIITKVLAKRDTLVLMPTGGGKSLCYQLPALRFKGLTLVVSPLIALMKDQVDGLLANGVPAGLLNSTLTAQEANQVQDQARQGKIKILYVAPERLALSGFQRFLQSLDVSLIAIDEAHCISEWGHDFRPDYRNLKSLRKDFPGVPVIALTATATEPVREDIVNQLALDKPEIFISSFNRPNLTYTIQPKTEPLGSLLHLLEKHQGGSAIIYRFSRKATEETALELSERGFSALPYHAGLERDLRRETQEKFIRDQVQIVVATIAFGMGIDKPDVRLVVHYDLPKTVEGYYQETGRAGRDGLPSDCVLFYSYGDRSKQEYFISQIEDDDEREKAHTKLEQVLALCDLQTCRRAYLMEYLGESWPETDCGGCDICLLPREEFDATEIAQKILSAAVRTGERFGVNYLVDVLRGSANKAVRTRGHHELPVFGISRDVDADELKEMVRSLVTNGLLAQNGGDYPTLGVSQKGRKFLNDREKLTLTRLKQTTPVQKTALAGDRETAYNTKLFDELAALRLEIATDREVPAYQIFGNKSLQQMAFHMPQNEVEFSKISGVGDAKLRDFSERFLEVINEYMQANGQPVAVNPVPVSAPKKRVRGISMSIRETKDLVAQGLSFEEVAEQRGISETTIRSHLERFIQEGGQIDLGHLMPTEDRRVKIESAFKEMGEARLTPVREFLGDDYTWDELAVVRMDMRQQGEPVG